MSKVISNKDHLGRFIFLLFSLLSIAFASYLIRVPSAAEISDPGISQAMLVLLWRGWVVNAIFMLLGIGASIAYLFGKPTRTRSVLAVTFSILFCLLFVAVAALQADSPAKWFDLKFPLWGQLYRAGQWTFLLAEAHRTVAVLVAAIAAVVAMRRI